PLIEVTQHRARLAEVKVASPTYHVGSQLLHHLLDAHAPRAARQRPDSLLEAFDRLRRNPPPWLPVAREAEPQELPLHWSCHRALLAVDLELQPPIDERR